jgi:hypothetical protein
MITQRSVEIFFPLSLAGPIRFVLEPYNGTLPRLRYNQNSWSKVSSSRSLSKKFLLKNKDRLTATLGMHITTSYSGREEQQHLVFISI